MGFLTFSTSGSPSSHSSHAQRRKDRYAKVKCSSCAEREKEHACILHYFCVQYWRI